MDENNPQQQQRQRHAAEDTSAARCEVGVAANPILQQWLLGVWLHAHALQQPVVCPITSYKVYPDGRCVGYQHLHHSLSMTGLPANITNVWLLLITQIHPVCSLPVALPRLAGLEVLVLLNWRLSPVSSLETGQQPAAGLP